MSMTELDIYHYYKQEYLIRHSNGLWLFTLDSVAHIYTLPCRTVGLHENEQKYLYEINIHALTFSNLFPG